MFGKVTTYIYKRQDGATVHVNACGVIIGEEYAHDDPAWFPPDDWPYDVRDLRKEE